MSQTRPVGEQLLFRSATTGDHILDTYLESCEKGSRTLPDMLDDLFDGNGGLQNSIFEFRYNPTTSQLQFRAGVFVDPEEGWSDTFGFLKPRGTFNAANTYAGTDIVTLANGDVYLVSGLATPQTFANETAFIASASTHLIISLEDVRQEVVNAQAEVLNARDWAIKTDGPVEGSERSAKHHALAAAVSAAEAAAPTEPAMDQFLRSPAQRWARKRA